MLRLSRIAGMHPAQTIKLEGKLLGPWVDEVRQACAACTGPSSRIRLDLSGLTFVDAAGVELLLDLIDRGIEIAACTRYVAELLRSMSGDTFFGGGSIPDHPG
jgi:ABC-type transporter Mla MlaB component